MHTVVEFDFAECAYQQTQNVFVQSHCTVITRIPPFREQCWQFNGSIITQFFTTVLPACSVSVGSQMSVVKIIVEFFFCLSNFSNPVRHLYLLTWTTRPLSPHKCSSAPCLRVHASCTSSARSSGLHRPGLLVWSQTGLLSWQRNNYTTTWTMTMTMTMMTSNLLQNCPGVSDVFQERVSEGLCHLPICKILTESNGTAKSVHRCI